MEQAPKRNPRRKPKPSGLAVLDAALAKAEAKEKKRLPPSQPVNGVRFVSGGMLNRSRPELGSHPTLRTSKGTTTGEEEEASGTPMTPRLRAKRCEIPLDYERINLLQLKGRLTEPAVFDMTRLFLAYLTEYRDDHCEGQTFYSVRVKLRSMGFPEKIEDIKRIYFSFCNQQGNSDAETERDLQIFRRHWETKRSTQVYAAARTRREADAQAYRDRSTGCDPECVIL